MVRKGWKEWAADGFPTLTPELRTKYRFDSRGTDTLVRITWDEAFTLIADALIAIARTYSGDEGRRILESQGYPSEMLDAMHGAGTRTIKGRGGMGLLGVIGKYGLYRFANMLGLLDAHVRGVPPEEALGGRKWSNYTWHGDQAPGLPFVHGLQSSEPDLNDLRLSKLHIQVGKNLVENKLAESHFFIELMERGGKIVVITPEYGPPATKADYWIPVRPGVTDTTLFLGISKIIIDEGLYDEQFVKEFTDFPLLVRTDTLKRLRAAEVFPDNRPRLQKDGASFSLQGLKQEQYEQLGDFVVFDETSGKLVPITRDDVGEKMRASNLSPALDWKGVVRLVDGKEVPPRWVPRPYLRQMFGPGVDEAIEKYTAPSRKLLAILQLFRATPKMIFRYEIEEGKKLREVTVRGREMKIYDDTVIGYGADGSVVARVSVNEPFVVRDKKYQNSI